MSHSFVGDDSFGDDPFDDDNGLEVRHIQPYQAVKTYRCPGCDQEIRPGVGHKVVVPRAAPEDRRHWHTSCWHREEKRTSGGPKKDQGKSKSKSKGKGTRGDRRR